MGFNSLGSLTRRTNDEALHFLRRNEQMHNLNAVTKIPFSEICFVANLSLLSVETDELPVP